MKTLKNFRDKIRIIFPDYRNKKLLVAVSGGPDSMAMLHFFHSEGCEVVAAHVNYGLRGKESDRDEKFVRTFCEQFNIEFVCLDAKLKLNVVMGNLQEMARKIRYAYFEEIRKDRNLDYILTAHHANDNAETLIFNLIRGSGIQGLQGISSHNGKIIRPFLLLTKKEILDYVENNQIPYITDSSNLKSIYTRNRIRKNILPEMEKENPQGISHASLTAFLISGYWLWMDQFLDKMKKKIIKKKEKCLEIVLPQTNHPAQKICLLYEILSKYGFGTQIIFQLFQSLNLPQGQEFETDSYLLKVLAKKILLTPKEKINVRQTQFITDSISGKWPDFVDAKVVRLTTSNLKTDKRTVMLPVKKLEFPLIWRHPKEGDYFRPFGMKGKKKIFDFLKDENVKSPFKEGIWLLTDKNEKIIWVVGFRMSEEFRVSDQDKEVLVLKLIKEQAI